MRTTWDLETDVLVIGYGLAGGVAASIAHDGGSDVLILEKNEYPGGCSIFAGGSAKCVEDAEAAREYLTVLSAGRVDDEVISAFAQALAENEDFIRQLAQVNGAELKRIPNTQGSYPYPGRETWYSLRIAKIPGFEGFPWMRCFLSPAGVNLIKLAMDNVESRGIPAMLSTPVRRLETDDSGVVIGAVAEKEGRELAVRARQAVVLATGGFEQSEWMRKQYLQGMPFFSMAPLTHTGDGIMMSQKVGAALWHMWLVHGSYGFKFPEYQLAFRHPFSGYRNPKRKMSWIVVDKMGSRYMNEYPPAPQDLPHRAMEIFDPDLPGYPRIPSLMIFDEVGRKREAIAQPLAFPGYEYNWSEDNSAEIERGWIIKANSIAELADAIKERFPENEGRMDAEQLEASVREWNMCVETGKDRFNRPPGSMMALATPPYYAAQVWPIITNTQGGPVHNAKQQVMDPFGQPIPRLYAVGELGSFFGHLYQLGGNIGECFTSGKIAGQNAAKETRLP
ncbi:MAG: FAD-binding protein [Chloroflexi bacterium]|nr:FAD-binding protein [Chloroflexota bacterium]